MPSIRARTRFACAVAAVVFAALVHAAPPDGSTAPPPAPGASEPSPAHPTTRANAQDASESLDARIRRHMADGVLVGIGAAIILDGRVAWSAGYGSADRQRGTPFTPDTVMNIGSISKTVTGVAMLRAVELGRLALDADVSRHLPFKLVHPRHPDRPITLRQLATHTSGIVDRGEVYARTYHFGADATEALGDFLAGYLVPGGRDYSADNFGSAPPGTHREYSNIGAGLAGYVVERATGTPLDVFTREHVFKPLGMTRTRWFMADAPMDDHATLYLVDDGMPIPIQPYGLVTWPDGGVRTSVSDLSKFFIAVLDRGSAAPRILSRRSLEDMRRFQFTPANTPDNVDPAEKNSGLFWSSKFDLHYVGHGGSDPGLKTEMLATPSLDTGVILFSNTAGPGTDKAFVAILKALFEAAQAMRVRAATS